MVYCVNDAAVMSAWADHMKIAGSNLTFLCDPRLELTKALGLELNHPGPMSKLGNTRCKRFAAYVVDGVVKHIEVSEAEDYPAGDDRPEASCIDNMLAKIAAL